jgi:predicted amidohydrolase
MIFKIGLCQFKPVLLNKAENLQTMKEMVDRIEADLIVFPECATSGYVFANKDEIYTVADDFEKSDTTAMFCELAKKNNTAYVVGFPENDKGKLYNSSMLINPDGTKYLYRKTHLFNEEKIFFEPGNLGFTVAKTKHDIKIGLMICFDWIFPESARTLMLKGAQIIAHCTNLVLPWCQQAMITRSLENRVFSVTANRIGTEKNGDKEFFFTGMSQIVSPIGDIIIRLNQENESVVITNIETDLANEKNINPYNHIITDRKTEYYS